MDVLIVGGGGREHALAWKAAQSNLTARVFVAPGNAGTAFEAGVENVDIKADDIAGLVAFAAQNKIALTIVGPEAPLVAGIADEFAQHNLACFAPSRAAAQLEGSKTFAKNFLHRHNIPTATYQSFNTVDDARAHLDSFAPDDFPCVIKADGLAAGKGVVIAADRAEADAAVDDMLTANRFGDAGSRVVVEEFLRGEEASFICIVDGETILPLASSQDHKAAHDGDRGPNTGGMGAYSPAPVVDDAMHQCIVDTVIKPTVRGLAAEDIAYCGFLYAGLMIGDDNIPRVLEFNCRLGDPETQPIMMRLKSDLVAHCYAATQNKLADENAEWDEHCALGVVIAAQGYPDKVESGDIITGLTEQSLHTKVFHAGTKLVDADTVTAGGRVLCVTATGNSVADAAQTAYQHTKKISWRGSWHRNDIGHRAIAREQSGA